MFTDGLGCHSLVKRLPCMHKTLGLIASSKKGKTSRSCLSCTGVSHSPFLARHCYLSGPGRNYHAWQSSDWPTPICCALTLHPVFLVYEGVRSHHKQSHNLVELRGLKPFLKLPGSSYIQDTLNLALESSQFPKSWLSMHLSALHCTPVKSHTIPQEAAVSASTLYCSTNTSEFKF